MNHKHQTIDELGNEWLSHSEGQLSVDVVETEEEIIVRSAIAGVTAEDLEITLSDDTLTIRGDRAHEYSESQSDQVHVQECHWGSFSRSIILPRSVDSENVEASLKRGILTICMKKVDMERTIPILELDDV